MTKSGMTKSLHLSPKLVMTGAKLEIGFGLAFMILVLGYAALTHPQGETVPATSMHRSRS